MKLLLDNGAIIRPDLTPEDKNGIYKTFCLLRNYNIDEDYAIKLISMNEMDF